MTAEQMPAIKWVEAVTLDDLWEEEILRVELLGSSRSTRATGTPTTANSSGTRSRPVRSWRRCWRELTAALGI